MAARRRPARGVTLFSFDNEKQPGMVAPGACPIGNGGVVESGRRAQATRFDDCAGSGFLVEP